MELSQSMFASSADYWKARAELAETTVHETAKALRCEADNEAMLAAVHNLNWALGTPGYEEMATAEEQAEHKEACARVDDMLERMAENKRKHDAAMKDAERYRKWRAAYTNPDGRPHALDPMLAAIADAWSPEQLDAAIDAAPASGAA